jgi:hypothetical protein
MAIEKMIPINGRLFRDEPMVAAWELIRQQCRAFEPAIEAVNQDIKQVVVRGVGIVSLAWNVERSKACHF